MLRGVVLLSLLLDLAPVCAWAEGSVARAFPSIFGAASAVAPPRGARFVALTLAHPRAGVAGWDPDGDVSFGMTFGSPVDGVSVTGVLTVTGLDPFGDSGSVAVSLSRLLRADDRSATFVGASAGNLARWGDSAEEDETALSIYATHLTGIQTRSGEVPLQLTFGYGQQTTYSRDIIGELGDGFFAGAGVGLTGNVAVSTSFTQTQFNIGATMTVPGVRGLSVSAGVYDASASAERRQLAATLAFSF